jgi:hypothetical protein
MTHRFVAFTPILNPKASFNLTAEARFTLGNFDPDNGVCRTLTV